MKQFFRFARDFFLIIGKREWDVEDKQREERNSMRFSAAVSGTQVNTADMPFSTK